MSLPDDLYIDPIESHLKRDSCQGAGVAVVVLGCEGSENAREVGESIRRLLADRSRSSDVIVVDPNERDNRGELLMETLRGVDQPLTILTRGRTPWTAAHLDPLLKAIDHCDHVVGRRAKSRSGRVGRWLASLPWRWLFAVPVCDVQSPCSIHRTATLKAIPLQSLTDFVTIEILAKATFLGQLLDEVAIPPIEESKPHISMQDFLRVFRHPTFRLPSIPAEDPEGEREGQNGPGAENGHGGGDLKERRAVEDDRSQSVEQLR